MSVVQTGRIWPGKSVPIVIDSLCRNGKYAAEYINTCSRCEIFHVVEGALPTHYLFLTKGGGGSGGGGLNGFNEKLLRRKVTANNFRAFLHELMHCLGFEHEQLHKYYLWNPSASLPATKKDLFNKIIMKIIDEVYKSPGSAAQNLDSWWKMRTQGAHSQIVDLDSVMMYPAFRQVLSKPNFLKLKKAMHRDRDTRLKNGAFLRLSRALCVESGALRLLSDGDIKAIRENYQKGDEHYGGRGIVDKNVNWDKVIKPHKNWNTKTIVKSEYTKNVQFVKPLTPGKKGTWDV